MDTDAIRATVQAIQPGHAVILKTSTAAKRHADDVAVTNRGAGKPVVVGIWRDITLLKANDPAATPPRRAGPADERTHRAGAQRVRAAPLMSTTEAFWRDTTTSLCQPAAARMLGFADSSELLHRHTTPWPTTATPTVGPTRGRMPHPPHLHRRQAPKRGHEVFWRRRHALPVLYNSAPLWEGGELKGAVVAFQDITARKQAEAQLREQVNFNRTLLQSIPNPVFYKGTDLRYLGCNPAFETYLGRTEAELVGRTTSDLAPPDLATLYEAQDRALLVQGGHQVYETRVNTAQGLRDVVFHKSTFHNAAGELAGLAGALWTSPTSATPSTRPRRPTGPKAPSWPT
jgi:PAS domain S-box-containing protein